MPRRRNKKKAAKAAVPSVEEGTPEFFKLQGNRAFAAENFRSAVDFYTQAIELTPSNHVLYSNRSAAYVAQMSKETSQLALVDADKCIELNESWPKGYFRRGNALRALRQGVSALAAFNQGLALDPDNLDIQNAIQVMERLKLTDGMSVAEAKAADGDGEDKDKFDVLEDWLLNAGSKFPKLYMKRYSANNRGVHASYDIKPDEQIMSIPQICLMTVEMGKQSPIGLKMLAYEVDVTAPKHCFLGVFVMQDRRNPDSFFQPYYNILPTEFDNMPIFWNEEQLAWLDGSYLRRQISDRRANIKADYDEIIRAAPEFADFSLEEFKWARMMVASRNFGVTVDGVETDALVPYADMLNHYRPRETKWTFNKELKSFTITSMAPLEAGRQIYDSYGKKCNHRFLLNYGFAVENNRDPDGKCHNEVRFMFRLPADAPMHSTKLGLLDGGEKNRGLRVSMTHDDKRTREAFSFMRFIHAADTEIMLLPQLGDEVDLQDTPIKPFSCENEISCLTHIAALAQEQLDKYPTTIEQDAEYLASTVGEWTNRRNCTILVHGEKEVCLHYIRLAQEAIPLLRQEWSAVKKVINKKYSSSSDFNNYINTIVKNLVRKRGSQQLARK